MAAANPDVHARPACAFGTFTQDLHGLADWFQFCGVTTVAMESTGVYWIPSFEILEARGSDAILRERPIRQACSWSPSVSGSDNISKSGHIML